MDEVRRAIAKRRAVLLAEFRLKQRLDAIDFQADVIDAEIAEIKDQVAKGLLPTTTAIEITEGSE